jgi:hypothetical protein
MHFDERNVRALRDALKAISEIIAHAPSAEKKRPCNIEPIACDVGQSRLS